MECLVVDDSSTVRKIARRHLSDIGYSVREATNGAEALDACAQSMPEMILLDWNMPVMSGIEFLRELRKSEAGQRPKVVFCTTEGDMDHIKTALEAGANEYVIKPFDRDVLEFKFELAQQAA